jgi:hypothetical protein
MALEEGHPDELSCNITQGLQAVAVGCGCDGLW